MNRANFFKRATYIIPFVALIFVLSCNKEISSPGYGFQLITNPDSLYAGELVTFDFSGSSSDNITIYTGDPGHDYSTYPVSKGAPVTTPYGKYYYTYPQGGNFTVTIIAENTGNSGKTTKEVTATLSISVKDRRALSITKFLVKSGSISSPAGTFNKSKDTITVLVEPGTNLTRLNPVVTKSADSAKINYGPGNILLGKKDSLDFTTPITFTISSTNNTSVKSYAVLVKERPKKKDAYLLTLSGNRQKVTISKPDTTNKKVTIKIPWGIGNITDSLVSVLTATTSANTKAKLGGLVINGKNVFALELNKKDTISVLSEDGTKTGKYAFKVTQDSAFTSFSINDSISSLNTSSQLVTIDHSAHTITIKLLGDAKLLKKGYIATFKGPEYATVKIGSVVQVSGTTKNYFSNPLTYLIISKDTGQTTVYNVSIVLTQ
jgi:hypothetical protein